MPVHTLGPGPIVSLRAPVPLVLGQSRRPQILDTIVIRPIVGVIKRTVWPLALVQGPNKASAK